MTVTLHRVLITELAELEHITGKRSTGALKNHITTRTDLCRVPYGRSYERLKRRSIMVASVMAMSSSRTKLAIAGFGLLILVGMSSTPKD